MKMADHCAAARSRWRRTTHAPSMRSAPTPAPPPTMRAGEAPPEVPESGRAVADVAGAEVSVVFSVAPAAEVSSEAEDAGGSLVDEASPELVFVAEGAVEAGAEPVPVADGEVGGRVVEDVVVEAGGVVAGGVVADGGAGGATEGCAPAPKATPTTLPGAGFRVAAPVEL